MISQRLRVAVKLSDLRAYKIAHRANLHPSTLSRIVNGIENVTPGDPRVLRIAEALGLKPADCFEEAGEMQDSISRTE
ncbi:MAG: helix-turn-helix transcriptional regulator [Thermodesulfobacteriota bacterium]